MDQPAWEALEEAIRKLSFNEKLDLVDAILDSMEEKDIPLAPAVQSVLGKRLASRERNKLEAKAWPEVRARWITDAKG
jgi:putative addiction module component (TIGR02574 family)